MYCSFCYHNNLVWVVDVSDVSNGTGDALSVEEELKDKITHKPTK